MLYLAESQDQKLYFFYIFHFNRTFMKWNIRVVRCRAKKNVC